MKILYTRALITLSSLAENVCRVLQKLILPLCNLFRMNLVSLRTLNERSLDYRLRIVLTIQRELLSELMMAVYVVRLAGCDAFNFG
jgi:hypothetical protein